LIYIDQRREYILSVTNIGKYLTSSANILYFF